MIKPTVLSVLALALGAPGALQAAGPSGGTRVLQPFDGAVYPSDIRGPVFRWQDADPADKVWLLRFSFKDAGRDFEVFADTTQWTPSREAWEDIKRASLEAPATFAVQGLRSRKASPASGRSSVRFSTSRDAVGAPIFFRAVPNPFPQGPADFKKVKWKLGWVSSYDPAITVMRQQERCFNCHTSTLDGRAIGFEYNPVLDEESGKNREDRAGYVFFTNPGRRVVWRGWDYLNWNDGLPKGDRKGHEAFVSVISPDGNFIVTGAKAKTFSITPIKDLLSYSFITKGVLLCYSVRDGRFFTLPGGDDERFVHTPTSWSPDGKTIYLHRARITPQLEEINRNPLAPEEMDKLKLLGWRELDRMYPFKYDVYRIPFNGGRGGKAEPVAGASGNGKSNFFAKVSPDGKWLVFAQTTNGFSTIRTDSDLYIVPAEGGAARKLRSSGPWAESWHSWSPGGRWMVFSSKKHPGRTDLLLTRIDERGFDSPPIVLEHLRDEDGLSANLPEFFNIRPGQLESIEPVLATWEVWAAKLWRRLAGKG